MFSRIDSDPEYHRQQLALAMQELDRRAIRDRKYTEWMKTRPGCILLNTMYRAFHGIGIDPFHPIESPLATEAELRTMARLSDEMGGEL